MHSAGPLSPPALTSGMHPYFTSEGRVFEGAFYSDHTPVINGIEVPNNTAGQPAHKFTVMSFNMQTKCHQHGDNIFDNGTPSLHSNNPFGISETPQQYEARLTAQAAKIKQLAEESQRRGLPLSIITLQEGNYFYDTHYIDAVNQQGEKYKKPIKTLNQGRLNNFLHQLGNGWSAQENPGDWNSEGDFRGLITIYNTNIFDLAQRRNQTTGQFEKKPAHHIKGKSPKNRALAMELWHKEGQFSVVSGNIHGDFNDPDDAKNMTEGIPRQFITKNSKHPVISICGGDFNRPVDGINDIYTNGQPTNVKENSIREFITIHEGKDANQGKPKNYDGMAIRSYNISQPKVYNLSNHFEFDTKGELIVVDSQNKKISSSNITPKPLLPAAIGENKPKKHATIHESQNQIKEITANNNGLKAPGHKVHPPSTTPIDSSGKSTTAIPYKDCKILAYTALFKILKLDPSNATELTKQENETSIALKDDKGEYNSFFYTNVTCIDYRAKDTGGNLLPPKSTVVMTDQQQKFEVDCGKEGKVHFWHDADGKLNLTAIGNTDLNNLKVRAKLQSIDATFYDASEKLLFRMNKDTAIDFNDAIDRGKTPLQTNNTPEVNNEDKDKENEEKENNDIPSDPEDRQSPPQAATPPLPTPLAPKERKQVEKRRIEEDDLESPDDREYEDSIYSESESTIDSDEDYDDRMSDLSEDDYDDRASDFSDDDFDDDDDELGGAISSYTDESRQIDISKVSTILQQHFIPNPQDNTMQFSRYWKYKIDDEIWVITEETRQKFANHMRPAYNHIKEYIGEEMSIELRTKLLIEKMNYEYSYNLNHQHDIAQNTLKNAQNLEGTLYNYPHRQQLANWVKKAEQSKIPQIKPANSLG